MREATKALKAYLLVAKPGIIVGNLICAAAGFFLASRGDVDLSLFLSTMIGISLVVASGSVLNNCIDIDLDRKMVRTRDRALVKGLISLKSAACYASFMGIAGLVLLWASTNLPCFAITLSGFVIYVGVYSLYLKRNSVYGALIGSLAGAAPPLAGYCAVSTRFDLGAAILLLIFSLWQMPHCYAIAIFRFDDYVAANIPVLPIKRGLPTAKNHIVGYISAFVTATLALNFGGYAGYGYLTVAVVLGAFWLYFIWTGFSTSNERLWAKRIYVFSILSIFALSVMMSIDFTIPAASDMLLSYAP